MQLTDSRCFMVNTCFTFPSKMAPSCPGYIARNPKYKTSHYYTARCSHNSLARDEHHHHYKNYNHHSCTYQRSRTHHIRDHSHTQTARSGGRRTTRHTSSNSIRGQADHHHHCHSPEYRHNDG